MYESLIEDLKEKQQKIYEQAYTSGFNEAFRIAEKGVKNCKDINKAKRYLKMLVDDSENIV